MCDGKNHNLESIFRSKGVAEDAVINWCIDCGAVVGDGEYDGRIKPGAIFKMKFPIKNMLALTIFNAEEIPKHFRNVEVCEHLTNKFQTIFSVHDVNGNQTATLQYYSSSKQWNIYVDNFPADKMEFSTTLPINNFAEFKRDIERTGVVLIESN